MSTPSGDTLAVNAPPARPYHHGDLARALVDEGFGLARQGGPDAVTLREAARRIGVSPTATYRHFADRDQLLAAVARRCREELARSLLAAIAAVRVRNRERRATLRFRACGRAYVLFGVSEPGLLSAAFVALPPPPGADEPDAYGVLLGCLNELIAVGALAPERRDSAALIAWTSVHGLAALAVAQNLPADDVLDGMIDIVGDGVERALGLPSEESSAIR